MGRATAILRRLEELWPQGRCASSWAPAAAWVAGSELGPWIAAGGLHTAWDRAGASVRVTPHKRTVRIALPGGRSAYLKRHRGRRAGARRSLPDRHLAGPLEALAACRLWAAGLAVPAVLGAGVERTGSWVLIAALEGHRTLEEELLSDPELVRRRLREVADLLSTLHLAGFYHRDFYACHLLHAGGALHLIDLERVAELGWRERRWREKDAAQFVHSLWDGLGRRAALVFLVRYGAVWGLSRAARRAMVRRVLRKRRRIAAHRSRYDAGTPGDLP